MSRPIVMGGQVASGSRAPRGARAPGDRWLATVAGAVAALSIVLCTEGCGHSCTLVGCQDGYAISFKTADGSWEPGDYVIDVEIDGKVEHCTYSWDGSVSPQGWAQVAPTCTGQLSAWFRSDASTSTTTGAGMYSSVATPIPGQFVQGLQFSGTPKLVAVTILKDGALLAERSFTPQYQAYYPNGEGCDEAPCMVASDDWVLP